MWIEKYCDAHISLCVCVCVCLSVCPRGYLRNHTRDLYHFFILCARCTVRKSQGEGAILGFFFPIDYAPYGFRGGNAPWFMCWLRRYIKFLFVCLLNFLPHFLYSLLSSFLMHWILLIYFLACLLPDLSIYFFQDRPVPFPGRRLQEARRRPNLTLFFWFILCCSRDYILLRIRVCFCCVCFSFSVLKSKPRDWLGRTSPKWPIGYFVSGGT